jgi:hypothetical protein
MAELRTLKVEPIAGEVINAEGIFDINVCSFSNTYCSFKEYLILVLFYENRECCMRSDWKRRDGAYVEANMMIWPATYLF